MSQAFTKAMARNIFYGGSVFFFLLFLGLTFDTHPEWPNSDNRENLTGVVADGKRRFGLPACIRVTVGTAADNQRFITALTSILDQ